MKDKIKNVSIIIVTYNSSKKLVKLIKKIPYQSPILIVDNSNDQKLTKILVSHPFLDCLGLMMNKGNFS